MSENSSGNNLPQLIGDQGEIIPPSPHKVDLRDAHAIRREMASVYRDMRSGKVEITDGTKLAYVLDLLRKAYETAELERRLTTLENIR